MDNNKKFIRFIDSHYNTLFYVPDGGSIRVHSKWDGKESVLPCKYLDSYHVEISGNCYHICQFAEIMEHNGNTYAPVTEIGDLEFYQKKYYDRDNVGADGKPTPYFSLIEKTTDKGTSAEVKTDYAFCLNPAVPEKAFCKFVWVNYSCESDKAFSAEIENLCDDEKLCFRINNIVASIKEAQSKTAPSLDEQIAKGAAQSSKQEPAASAPSREVSL